MIEFIEPSWLRLFRHIRVRPVLLGVLAAVCPHEAAATKQNPMDICELAAQKAAQASGVPEDILRTISRLETGRKSEGRFGPWPWTVNMEGKGVWFESDDAARAYVYKHFKRGARSFDVGCFQINYRWHHQEFTSLEEMFDPLIGAHYAAKFLKTWHRELGSWEAAAGAYHSRAPRHANRYKALFRKHYAEVSITPVVSRNVPQAKSQPSAKRRNLYPLRGRGRGAGSAGSLVFLEDNTQAPGLLNRAVRGVLK